MNRPLTTNECWTMINQMFIEGKIHRYRIHDRDRLIADVSSLITLLKGESRVKYLRPRGGYKGSKLSRKKKWSWYRRNG